MFCLRTPYVTSTALHARSQTVNKVTNTVVTRSQYFILCELQHKSTDAKRKHTNLSAFRNFTSKTKFPYHCHVDFLYAYTVASKFLFAILFRKPGVKAKNKFANLLQAYSKEIVKTKRYFKKPIQHLLQHRLVNIHTLIFYNL
jgi:hypothetical protein